MTLVRPAIVGSTMIAIAAILTGPASAETYRIVVEGKDAYVVECPAPADGRSLAWIDQNCRSALRSGAYSKTLTFTLSTTSPSPPPPTLSGQQ